MSKLTKTGLFIAVATATYMTGTMAVTLWVGSQPYSSITTVVEPLKMDKPRLPPVIEKAVELGWRLAEWEDKKNRERINKGREDRVKMDSYHRVWDIIEKAEQQ